MVDYSFKLDLLSILLTAFQTGGAGRFELMALGG